MHTHVFPYFIPSTMAHILTHTHLYSQHSDLELKLNDMSMSTVLFSTTYEYHIIISSSYFVDTPLNSALSWKRRNGKSKKKRKPPVNKRKPTENPTQNTTQNPSLEAKRHETMHRGKEPDDKTRKYVQVNNYVSL